MKIIAKTHKGFILDCEADEVANLIGYWSTYINREKGYIELMIGTEIRVAEIYKHLYSLAAAAKSLKECEEKMVALSRLLTLPPPVVELVAATK